MPDVASSIQAPLVALRNGRTINPNVMFLCNHEAKKGSYEAFKKSRKPVDVEVPQASFREIDDIPISSVKLSKDYFVYKAPAKDDLDEIVEYEEDELDQLWLPKLNERIKKEKAKPLSSDEFCKIMDRLEKESNFQPKATNGYVSSSSPDDVCCVCGDGDDDNANQIIYCDLCNIAVHQECYGVPYIPEGSWMCRRCKLSPSKTVRCVLCPNLDGAFKQTADGNWAHVICAIWLNEVHFGNAVFLEPVEGVHDSLEKRSALKCLICRKKMGACMQCSQRSCVRAFHVTCAQAAQMYMQVVADDDSDASDKMDVQRFCYCQVHDPRDSEPDVAVKKKKLVDACKQAYKLLKKRKDRAAPVNMPVISQTKVDSIANRHSVQHCMRALHDYWYQKRKTRCGVPLIRRLQAEVESRTNTQQTLMDDPDVKETIMYYQHRRFELEKVRMLSELVKKRESAKYRHLHTSIDLFEKVFKPTEMLLLDVVDTLKRKDFRKKVFWDPVTEAAVPGYRTIISRPMDLSTMRLKCQQNKYNSLADLKKDFDLMCNNCETFNKDTEFFLSYGRRFRKRGEEVFASCSEKLRQRQQLLDSDDPILNHAIQVCYFEGSGDEDRVKENAPIVSAPLISEIGDAEEDDDDRKNMRRNPFEATTPSTFSVFSRKRKPEENIFTPVSKRRRGKEENQSGCQTSITKFFTPATPTTPSAPEARRSLRTAAAHNQNTQPATTPFSAFRDLPAIQSPLAADVASSAESSTEDEEKTRETALTRSTRRRQRIEPTSTEAGMFMHNDIVKVSLSGRTVIGRYMDPQLVSVEDVPKDLITDCRMGWRNNPGQVCVLIFGDDKKAIWEWFPPESVHVIDLERDSLPNSKQTRLAREFKNRLVSAN